MEITYPDNDKRYYKGLKNLLILVYLALEDKHEAKHLANFIFVENKNPQNSFDRALSNLKSNLDLDIVASETNQEVAETSNQRKRKRSALPYFFIEGNSPRNNSRTLELNPLYLTHLNNLPSDDIEDKPTIYMDFLALEHACKAGDLAAITNIYQGAFLAGFEEEIPAIKRRGSTRVNKISGDSLPEYLYWIEDKRYYFANLVLVQTISQLEQSLTVNQKAESLLDFLFESHDLVVFSAGMLADAYRLLSKEKQDVLRDKVISFLEQQPEKGYLRVLYALALQKNPSLALACKVCQLNSEEQAKLIMVYDSNDWVNNHNPDKLISGHKFLQAALAEPSQRSVKYALLHQLFALTPEQNHAELFHLAWSYQQDTGSFGDMAWRKICRVLAFQVREYCRYGEFVKAQAVCEAWERARAQREEKTDEDLHFYHAYSLERQNFYQQAWDVLAMQLHIKSIRHQALQACLHERMHTLEASEMQLQHLYPHIAAILKHEGEPQKLLDSIYARAAGPSPEEAWARAEIYSIKGRLAYNQQDYALSVEYSRHAIALWQECHEPYRVLGLRNNIACAYDNSNDVTAALAEYTLIENELKKYPQLRSLALRRRLNKLILLAKHKQEPYDILCQRYEDVIADLREGDGSAFPEILGKALYDFGYYHQEMGQFDTAIERYHEAIPLLSDNKDKVTFGCSYGEMSYCYYKILVKNVAQPCLSNHKTVMLNASQELRIYQTNLQDKGKSAAQTAIDILERIGNDYAENYRKVLHDLESVVLP